MARKWWRKVYDRLPPVLQERALEVHGVRGRVHLQRSLSIVQSLEESETWSQAAQMAYVAQRLRLVIDHAVRHVPRYEGYARLLPELRAGDQEVLHVLRELPPIERDEVLSDPESFRSRVVPRTGLVSSSTSGTTGSPVTFFLEKRAVAVSDALWWRRTVWAGLNSSDWIARLVGDPAVPLGQAGTARPYRISHSDHRLYLSTYHLNAETANVMARCLEARRPAFLMGYPSALDTLARLATPVSGGWRPKAILYSSEPMYEHQRQSVAAFVCAPIRGLYGCAERIVSAAECEWGNYHLGLVDGYVEGQFEIDQAETSSRATGLLSLAMPLLRYDLGDAITVRPSAVCRCGRSLPVIDSVITKQEDVVVTPSGRVISPSLLTWAFKDLTGIRQSQIVQRGDLSIEIRLVVSAKADDSLDGTLSRRVSEMLFEEVPVSVVRVPSLAVTLAGKSRFVVNECLSAGGIRAWGGRSVG